MLQWVLYSVFELRRVLRGGFIPHIKMLGYVCVNPAVENVMGFSRSLISSLSLSLSLFAKRAIEGTHHGTRHTHTHSS
jgi:hypothetical protein